MRKLNTNTILYPILVLLLLMPWAAFGAGFMDVWSPPDTDKSINYLLQIFGSMPPVLTSPTVGANILIANLFKIFNIAILTLGSLTVTYTIILSSINTAHEGEAMGKKWSSVWIPLRSAIGIAFLVPTASGYSLIQVMMMKFVVLGIGAADVLWNSVVDSMDTGPGVFGTTTVDNSSQQLTNAATGFLKGMTCQQVLNTEPACQTALGNKVVGAYTVGNNGYIGVQGDSTFGNICGTMQPGNLPGNAQLDPTEWDNASINAFLTTSNYLAMAAGNALVGGNINTQTWSQPYIDQASKDIQTTLITVQPLPSTDTNTIWQTSKDNGWFFAGSYYFSLVSHSKNLTYNAPVYMPSDNLASALTDPCRTAVVTAMSNVVPYTSANEPVPASVPSKLNLSSPSSGGGGFDFSKFIMKPMRDGVYKLFDTLTDSNQDPIISLRDYGAHLMGLCEILWLSLLIVAFALMIGACIYNGFQPACYAVGIVMSIFAPAFAAIIALLWGAGAAIGLYLPLVPYLVFTFTALGWLLLVVETIVAAPIVALGLVSPSQEHLGKASPAIMLIANVFMRPSLMVIGLMVAIKLVRAAVQMVNFGFTATLDAAVQGIGIFGCIALIYLYCGIVLAVINEAFSLIHVLPDKIIRWIGGQAESSGVKEKMEEAKAAADSGIKTATDVAKVATDKLEEKGKEAVKAGPGDKKMATMGEAKNAANKWGVEKAEKFDKGVHDTIQSIKDAPKNLKEFGKGIIEAGRAKTNTPSPLPDDTSGTMGTSGTGSTGTGPKAPKGRPGPLPSSETIEGSTGTGTGSSGPPGPPPPRTPGKGPPPLPKKGGTGGTSGTGGTDGTAF